MSESRSSAFSKPYDTSSGSPGLSLDMSGGSSSVGGLARNADRPSHLVQLSGGLMGSSMAGTRPNYNPSPSRSQISSMGGIWNKVSSALGKGGGMRGGGLGGGMTGGGGGDFWRIT